MVTHHFARMRSYREEIGRPAELNVHGPSVEDYLNSDLWAGRRGWGGAQVV